MSETDGKQPEIQAVEHPLPQDVGPDVLHRRGDQVDGRVGSDLFALILAGKSGEWITVESAVEAVIGEG